MSFGSEAIKLLAQYDVDTIFGIPGVHTIEYYRGITETGMNSIIPRHEQGAAFMADGYARISKKPGVCVLVSGPGALNAATPIAQAWHDSIPLLVIAASTDSEQRGKNRGPLHDVPDQALFFEQLTFASKTVETPEEFSRIIAETFHSWEVGRPRPVHISVPTDILESEAKPFTKFEIPVLKQSPKSEDISALSQALTVAESPVIICGGGALGAANEIQKLAEKISAPVITTGNARGILPHTHPLNVGTLMAFAGTRELLEDSDLVIAIGTEISDVDIIYTGKRLPQPKKLVRVDIDSAQLNAGLSSWLGIQSDSLTFVSNLLSAIDGYSSPRDLEKIRKRVQLIKDSVTWTDQSRSHFAWLDAIDSALPTDAIVAIDSTQLAYTAHHYMPWSKPGEWLAPYGLGTLGPALPMALGAKVASPEKPVLVIAGDGGFLFTIQELATARDLSGNVVVVIWDNAGYSEIRDSFDRAKAPRNGVDVQTFDLVKIAQGFGLFSERISTPDQLSKSLTEAFTRNSPSVLVVTEPGSPADK